MREIKFRAYCEIDGSEGTHINKMVYFKPISCDNGIFMDAPDDVYHINEYHSELMQFTGLKDKHGKSIFEGDVLTSRAYPYQDNGKYNYHAVVEWIYSSWQVVMKCVNSKKSGISDGVNWVLDQDYNDSMKFEIIGNIHETPHQPKPNN